MQDQLPGYFFRFSKGFRYIRSGGEIGWDSSHNTRCKGVLADHLSGNVVHLQGACFTGLIIDKKRVMRTEYV